jgi:hypothetical protein
MIYPGSIPEFRVLVKAGGVQVLQVRYVNSTMGYMGKWQNVPVEIKDDPTNIP